MSQPEFVDLVTLPPLVLDQTVSPEEPQVSVRVPIWSMKSTHETYYLEMVYKKKGHEVFSTFHFSPRILAMLFESQAALDNLSPALLTEDIPARTWVLGDINILFAALSKLKQFHDAGQWWIHLEGRK